MNNRIVLCLSVLLVILIISAGCSDAEPASSTSPGGSTPRGGSAGGVSADVSAMDSVLPSTYLQLADLKINFIDFDILNPTDSVKTVIVESEIPGFTEKSVNTVEVPAHGNITVGQTPSLRTSAIPSEMTSATLHYKVALTDGTRIDEQTYPIKIYAKDTMIWAITDGEEWTDMTPFIGAWVTPHAAEIDPLVRKAAGYSADNTMTGYQCGDTCSDAAWQKYSDDQVKAIFTALKNDYQITYINSPIAYGKVSENPQRVRLPKDSLAQNSANCIDGTVLYASALESIGMTPHIIILPTHAFVCYETKPDSPDKISCLETTMTGSSTFEDAVSYANQEYREEIANGNFASGKSQDLSIATLRESGILPMQ
ncbi:MAG: hypothetical protein Q7T80_04495 [Methanoregula sp.]|nr:hypothetical protein [Methanoregula sp.]